MTSAEGIANLISWSEKHAEGHKAAQLVRYFQLLEKWNARMNLTASTKWPALKPLFEEAVWAARLYPTDPVRHLDIGSGAGFPAIPMRILRPDMRLDLVEKRLKRAVFLESVVDQLELQNVKVYPERLDSFLYARANEAQWDSVSWKGLKLSPKDLSLLLSGASKPMYFWIFHGKDVPMGLPPSLITQIKLAKRESLPSRKTSFLSIYRALPGNFLFVSRETNFANDE